MRKRKSDHLNRVTDNSDSDSDGIPLLKKTKLRDVKAENTIGTTKIAPTKPTKQTKPTISTSAAVLPTITEIIPRLPPLPWVECGVLFDEKRASQYYAAIKALIVENDAKHGQTEKISPYRRGPGGEPIMYTQKLLKIFLSKDGSGYTFTGSEEPSRGWPPILQELALEMSKIVHTVDGSHQTFDGCHANYYRNRKDCLSSHADKGKPGWIGSISLYENPRDTRDFQIFTKKGLLIKTIPLRHGEVFLMRPGMQKTHKHGVPIVKLADGGALIGGRINLTLRQLNPVSKKVEKVKIKSKIEKVKIKSKT